MDAAIFERLDSMVGKSVEATPSQKILSDCTEFEDDQAGPVFVQLPDQMGWTKVNNFSACDQCRISHVKCSLSVSGGPCSHCKNRNQLCKVYGWVFQPEWPAHHIYKPVLPPPPVAPSSPLYSSKMDEYKFELELLVHKLNWLQCEAPRKFRRRSSAMPWKDEPSVNAPKNQTRKRLPSPQVPNSEIQCLKNRRREASYPDQSSKRRRSLMDAEISNRKYDCEGNEPMPPRGQHRMSISFILSPCNIAPNRPEKKNEGSAVSSNGWESRRTSLASSDAGWSARSDTRSPSLPAVDVLSEATDSSYIIPFRSPPVPHRIQKHEILSRFKEWRPPFNTPVI